MKKLLIVLMILGFTPVLAVAHEEGSAQAASGTAKVTKMSKKKDRKKKMNAKAKQVWICPMHPEVTGEQAGKCPKCGMDLVKEEKK